MCASKPRPATAIANVFWWSVAAGLDALVTEDALRVVAHVEVVVDLHGLRDRRCVRAEARRIRRRSARCTRAPPARSRGRPTSRAARARAGGTCRTRSRVGVHDHPRLDLARAGRHERARALELDDADAADVHRRERVAVAERRRVDRRASGTRRGSSSPRARAPPRRRRSARPSASVPRAASSGHRAKTPRFAIGRLDGVRGGLPEAADRRVAHHLRELGEHLELVLPFARPAASRCSASSWRTVPTRHGTHWPHDSSRKNSAMRSTAPTRSAPSS